ncbi:MAG: MFS transporter, partial [Nocardioides sp.]
MTPAETDTTAPGRLGPLHHRNFRLLVTGTTTSSLGNAITPVALAFAVLDLGGSATQLGLVVAAYALAEVVTVLFGG